MDFRKYVIIGLTLAFVHSHAAEYYDFTFYILKYGGGGDWYDSKIGIPNLLDSLRQETGLNANPTPIEVAPADAELFLAPLVYINGHGNISFTERERAQLRRYVASGGFIFANDDYGMDEAFRREMELLFPDASLVDIPASHEIYHLFHSFPTGMPKIHEHDGGAPKGLGIFVDGRLVVFYAYNTDIGDGFADADVHDNPEEKRREALRMGVNIILYALHN